ncbi:hypothetical protein TIFTF001_053017, partial [Ficus carica]
MEKTDLPADGFGDDAGPINDSFGDGDSLFFGDLCGITTANLAQPLVHRSCGLHYGGWAALLSVARNHVLGGLHGDCIPRCYRLGCQRAGNIENVAELNLRGLPWLMLFLCSAFDHVVAGFSVWIFEAAPTLRHLEAPIKYGNVFNVSSQLASKPITPRFAAVAQAAENKVLGQTPNVSAASVMESGAAKNEQAGLEPITIGEALEATAFSAANKPVDQIDAAKIQAAEMRATGFNEALPGCVAAAAQAVADLNAGKARDEDKAKLSNVLA